MSERPIKTAADWIALFGRRARELGLTHLEVDDRAGLGDGHFGKLMCGARTPSLQTIERLCSALDLAFMPIDARSCVDDTPQLSHSDAR